MSDLFSNVSATAEDYSAKDIQVLEGLEPVRQRPGMYIGGTDERALHHLAAEVLDNSMDEAVAGHASWIEVSLNEDGSLTISDNGRGIPVDPHPKFKDKSALEVILTTLHSGGKFEKGAYATSGGLHGVGISVVNALSDRLDVEVARDRQLYRQSYSRGHALSKIENIGPTQNRRGTKITFHADADIFKEGNTFKAARLYKMARSKAYLFKGVEIRWSCPEELVKNQPDIPHEAVLHFPGGLVDFIDDALKDTRCVLDEAFAGNADFVDGQGRVEWAIKWPVYADGFANWYCNTIPTPQGGTHESGFRAAMVKGLRAFGEMSGNKKADKINADDVLGMSYIMLSVFIHDPQFQGQTKDRLTSNEAAKYVESTVRDRFDHWLTSDPDRANVLLNAIIERMEDRMRRRAEKEVKRKSAVGHRKLRLPGKLTDCSQDEAAGTEIFIVEGDSAGGSAKQARDRKTQAILPIRGKILNVASANNQKISANQEISDLNKALGCGSRDKYKESDLRYERVVIMTDADVDGAHIATLLMTFFFREMPELVENGHLFLAQPPLYRIAQGGKVIYARDDKHKDELMETEFSGKGKIEISRFKGLGEMPPAQLKETTMKRDNRTLLRITLPEEYSERNATTVLVEDLMGKKPEKRFAFIRDNASQVESIDI